MRKCFLPGDLRNDIAVQQWLHKQRVPVQKLFVLAASQGLLECLVHLVQRGLRWTTDTWSSQCRGVPLSCYAYLNMYDSIPGVIEDYHYEHVDSLEAYMGVCYLVEIQWNRNFRDRLYFRKSGARSRLSPFHALIYSRINGGWTTFFTSELDLAATRSLECFEYVKREKCWYRPVCSSPTSNSFQNYEMRRALSELMHVGITDRPFEGPPCSVSTLKCVVHYQICKYESRCCKYAAQLGSVECLRLLHRNGYQWDEKSWDAAAEAGSIECLRYLHKHKCPKGQHACLAAAKSGSLPCLEFTHRHGFEMNEFTLMCAVMGGSIECMEYAYKHGCSWHSLVSYTAAEHNFLAGLEYAHANGCPWFDGTCLRAAELGAFECLRFAVEHGCPRDERVYAEAKSNNYLAMARYLASRGFLE